MKKIILCISFFALSVLFVNAQSQSERNEKFNYSIGLNLGTAVGNAKDYVGYVVGGDVQVQYNVATKIKATLDAGYFSYSNKNEPGATKLIPLLAGAKFYLTDKFFGHAQLGVSFSTEKGAGNGFTYVPSIGYDLSNDFDIAVKYQAVTQSGETTSFIGLRAAFHF